MILEDLLSSRCFPNLYGGIGPANVRGGDVSSTGQPCHSRDHADMTLIHGNDAFATRDIQGCSRPDLNSSVQAGRGDSLSIRGPGNNDHSTKMTMIGEGIDSCCSFPYLYRSIMAARGNKVPIR